MMGILIALQAGPSTVDQLATRFEVSRRTILRDIEQLYQLDVPIVARPGVGGGYRLPSWWSFAPANLTPQEIETLLLALDHLEPGSGDHLPGLVTLTEKLRAVLHPASLAAVSADPARPRVRPDLRLPDPPVLATIRRAISEGDWLEIAYSGGNRTSPRFVLPRSSHIAGGRWYLVAIDAERRDIRHFRIDRIAEAHRRLHPPDAADILAEAAARPEYAAPDHPEIAFTVTDRGRQRCLDHPTFREHLTDHTVRLRCPPDELQYYMREVIQLGAEATLIESPEARSVLVTQLRTLLAHHDSEQ